MNEQTFTSLADLMVVDKTIKHETCETHGDYESRNIFRKLWSGCPACAADAQAVKQREDAEREAQERHAAWQRRLGEAGIPKRFKDRTLDVYRAENTGQQKALKFAKQYAENFDEVLESGRSAIFCGKPGTGKTHLSIGIALHVMAQGNCALFTTVQRMARMMKDTFRKESIESECGVIEILTYPDLLIVDEVGVQFGTEFEKNLIFDVVNERYEAMKPTLFLTNLIRDDVKDYLGHRIYDRMKENGGQIVAFDWESHRGAQYGVKVLGKKLQYQTLDYPPMGWSEWKDVPTVIAE